MSNTTTNYVFVITTSIYGKNTLKKGDLFWLMVSEGLSLSCWRRRVKKPSSWYPWNGLKNGKTPDPARIPRIPVIQVWTHEWCCHTLRHSKGCDSFLGLRQAVQEFRSRRVPECMAWVVTALPFHAHNVQWKINGLAQPRTGLSKATSESRSHTMSCP